MPSTPKRKRAKKRVVGVAPGTTTIAFKRIPRNEKGRFVAGPRTHYITLCDYIEDKCYPTLNPTSKRKKRKS